MQHRSCLDVLGPEWGDSKCALAREGILIVTQPIQLDVSDIFWLLMFLFGGSLKRAQWGKGNAAGVLSKLKIVDLPLDQR